MYMYTSSCALSDLKIKKKQLNKGFLCLRYDKRFKKRKGNLQILWCFFRRLKNYEKRAAKCLDNQLKHPKLFSKEILKRTHQEHA